MITRAVILAAGRRRGQNGHDTLGPLVLVEGERLLYRNLRVLAAAGVTDVAVVVGYRGDEIRTAITNLGKTGHPAIPGLQVTVFENPEWRRPSGLSLLAARAFVKERTFCILGDRQVHLDVLRPVARLDADGAECVMFVDSDLAACADLREATRLVLAGGHPGRVVDAGEDLVDFQAYDSGHALVSPALLHALDGLVHPKVVDGLSEMARRGLVRAHEIGGRDWRRVGGFDAGAAADPRGDASADRSVADHVAGLLEPKGGSYVLLNPGPVNTTARVKSALIHHDVCHRDSDYSEGLVRLDRKLRRIFRGGQDHSVVILTGSGTAAMEMAISSVVPPDRKILVLDNGAFGARLAEICELHRLDLVRLRYEYGQEIRVADVRAALEANPGVAAVAMCHHETSVGLLNPVREVGALCREFDALLLVDAVSSLGAEDLDVVRDEIDVCWGSANKCLHGISGVAFLCVSPRVWPRLEEVKPRSYYLDLKRYRWYSEELAQTPFTPAVATYAALEVACDEYLEDGAVVRQELYASRNSKLREGLRRLGLGFYTETGRESHAILTPRLPDYVKFGELYEDLKSRGFVIYDCKAPLKGTHFQLANMGDLPDATLDAFLAAFGAALERARARRLTSRGAAAKAQGQTQPAVPTRAGTA